MSKGPKKLEQEDLIISDEGDTVNRNSSERNIIELEDRLEFAYTAEDMKKLMNDKDCSQFSDVSEIEKLAEGLKTDLKRGLSDYEFQTGFRFRRKIFGRNEYKAPPAVSFILLFLSVWKDTTIIILSVAAAISLLLGVVVPTNNASNKVANDDTNPGWVDGLAIITAVIVVAVVTAFNEWNKDRQFRKLNEKKRELQTKVIRNGVTLSIDATDVNVGDICLLETGDEIPADGIIFQCYELYVDESTATGESKPKKKEMKGDIFVYGGSVVTGGIGRMLVTCVGMNTQFGQAIKAIESAFDNDKTPLQERLEKLAMIIGKVGLAVAVIVFVLLTIWWFVNDVYGHPWAWSNLKKVIDNCVIAITIVVVAVPEGLPLAVTISLAYSMKQMMADQNLVRYLAACETMGGVTTICTDKTGTLTTNRMTVTSGWIGGIRFDGLPFTSPLKKKLREHLEVSISVNSTANILVHEYPHPIQYIGNQTECALLMFIRSLGANYRDIRDRYRVVGVLTFSSERKRMSTIIENSGKSSKYRLYIKGQPEYVISHSKYVLNEKGKPQPIDDFKMSELRGIVESLTSRGLRTLALAYRDFDGEIKQWTEQHEVDLTCIAIVGIEDPLRADVPRAVRECQMAGIFVRMVTGDNVQTAIKIARECGILTPDGVVLEGSQFRTMSPQEIDEVLPRLQVLARSSPIDKYNLVKRLKASGEVVAVTGDGTNDAPALKVADVGLAMGLSGTEAAKRASDIVILDDNFASIVKSVMWGRNVFDNIRKFLQFQLTVNVVALLLSFAGAVTNYGTPLHAIQLLWVNIIMDSLAALALGTEKPTRDLLRRKPVGRRGGLLSNRMIRNILCHAVYQLIILLVVVYGGHWLWNVPPGKDIRGPTVHYTIVFNTFVFIQIFNEINCRKVNDGTRLSFVSSMKPPHAIAVITLLKYFLSLIFFLTLL
jgi:Ca2+-transporting ATPase